MTIRRQWLIVLTVTAVLAVCVNSLILSSLIRKYFLTYSAEDYDRHVGQIEQLALNALENGGITGQQLSAQLESHLDDPIVSIRLYDARGALVASAEDKRGGGYGMMNGKMQKSSEEADAFELYSDSGAALGELIVTRYSSLNKSMVSVMFEAALLRNSIISFVVVLFVLLIIGFFVSRRLSRDLSDTASQALCIDLGGQSDYKASRVKEISIIQSSLETLRSRLKIRQTARKRAVDELAHQIRTPLTVLKTHLEGLEDGLIKFSGEEIKVCREQVDNIQDMIANMSFLIEADRPAEANRTEEIDLNSLLLNIIGGLKIQFDKKHIGLRLLSDRKALIKTDKHKLSRCIYNLLTNAYKYTPSGGKVEITYELSGDEVVIKVRDNGKGIAREDLPYLFDAYFRGRNTYGETGDGLGLYVVKENLRQLGGSVGVESSPGSGSVFTISLPLE